VPSSAPDSEHSSATSAARSPPQSLGLFVIPPLAAQLLTDAGSWIRPTLFAVVSGVSTETSLGAAVLAVGAWALIPAAAGLVAVQRRDVV
jgi:ABC-2 type transport system permease protein